MLPERQPLETQSLPGRDQGINIMIWILLEPSFGQTERQAGTHLSDH